MKRRKHGRKIGYGIAGITIGIVIYLLLQSKVPLSVDARATLVEFENEQSSSEHVLDDEDYNGIVEPFLEYGSYHVSVSELNYYEGNSTVKYGKANPTFFLEREEPKVEEDIEVEENNVEDDSNSKDKSKAPDLPHFKSDSTEDDRDTESTKSTKSTNTTENSSKHSGGNSLEGFNIHTRQLESADVSFIEEQFMKYGVLPVDEKHYYISSDFGVRIDPFEKTEAYHVGLDMATQTIQGANIYSVLKGQVIEKVSGDKGLGNYIIVKHDGFETLYAHMKTASILSVGDLVEAGDLLGYVGSTGRSTGPHLHFEVGIGGLKFNPEIFINKIGRID